MGNVHASGSPPPPPTFLAPEPPPPPNYSEKASSGTLKPEQDSMQHPGVMEDLHKRTKGWKMENLGLNLTSSG